MQEHGRKVACCVRERINCSALARQGAQLGNAGAACYVACMHAWQPARLATAFGAIEGAGLSKADISRIAGIHRSQVSRWFSGEQRPGYDAAMRIAGYLKDEHPDLAAEFTTAAGYSGPVEPRPESPIPPSLMDTIRRVFNPEEQEKAIAALEEALSPAPPPEAPPPAAPAAAAEGQSAPSRRAGLPRPVSA